MSRVTCFLVLGISGALLASGCAELTHLTTDKALPSGKDAPSQGKAIIVDAKQRLITAAPVVKVEAQGGNETTKYIALCAEPSPDALSALAAGYGISLSQKEKADLASSFSIAEGAGSIGLRTQSIQLMRDAMFRLCEGYQSGAVDSLAFQTLHRRFQSSMVAILAIEQITGAMRAPAVAIGGNALVGKAELAAELTAKKEAAVNLLREAENALKAKKTADDEAGKKVNGLETKVSEAEAAGEAETVKSLQAELGKAKEDKEKTGKDLEAATTLRNDRASALDAIEAARAQAIAGNATAVMVANVSYPAGSLPDSSRIGEVAKEVTQIVRSTLELNFAPEVCATILLSRGSQAGKITPSKVPEDGGAVTTDDALLTSCLEFLKESVQLAKNSANLLDAAAEKIRESRGALDPRLIEEVRKLQTEAAKTALGR